MKQPQARLLARRDLDAARWDKAVQRAPYGLSWWLDAVTDKNWYGVVLDDYRLVMPLPVNRNLGPLKLINGAPFTQHQGPFGTFRAGDLELMLAVIPKYWHVRKLAVYPPCSPAEAPGGWKMTSRANHELSLAAEYTALARNYRGNLRRKLRDFPPTDLTEWSLPCFLDFYRKHVGAKSQLSDKSLLVLKNLTSEVIRRKAGACYHLTGDAGETIAALLLVRHGNRVFNLLAASSPKGFALHGMTRLLDGVIRDQAGTETILDFEGSDLPGVALFFRGFGAQRVGYWSLRR